MCPSLQSSFLPPVQTFESMLKWHRQAQPESLDFPFKRFNLLVVSIETIATFGGFKKGSGGNPVCLWVSLCQPKRGSFLPKDLCIRDPPSNIFQPRSHQGRRSGMYAWTAGSLEMPAMPDWASSCACNHSGLEHGGFVLWQPRVAIGRRLCIVLEIKAQVFWNLDLPFAFFSPPGKKRTCVQW